MDFQPHNPLWWVDLTLVLAGLCILGIGATRCVRTKRDPLRGSPLRRNMLNVVHVWLCLMVYVLAGWLGLSIAKHFIPPNLSAEQNEAWRGVIGYNLQAGTVILTCFIVASNTFKHGLRGFLLGNKSIRSELLYGIGGWLAALAVTSLVLLISESLIPRFFPDFKPPQHTVFQMLAAPSTTAFMRFIAIAGAFLAAPIMEEAIFRGILQTALHKVVPRAWHSLRHRWLAILATGIIFGAMHGPTPQHIPALIALGILLGFIYERRGALLTPVIVHMLFNGKSLLWRELEPYVAALALMLF